MKRYTIAAGIFVLLAVCVAAVCVKLEKNPPTVSLANRHSAAPAAPEKKIVYLTFDADMTASMEARLKANKVAAWYDPELISYLSDGHIPATFFITGMFAEIYPETVKAIASNPEFTIGNHSYDHPGFESPCYNLRVIGNANEKIDEIQKTQAILENITGTAPHYFRFPGLCHKPADDTLVANLHLTVVDGIASGDAYLKNPEAIARHVVDVVKDGDIIVMHMGGPNTPATTAALKKLVPQLEKLGYGFKQL